VIEQEAFENPCGFLGNIDNQRLEYNAAESTVIENAAFQVDFTYLIRMPDVHSLMSSDQFLDAEE
jgi:hypothetical protein